MSTTAVLRRLVAVSAPPWGRLAAAAALGLGGAAATLGLLAGSGYVVDKAALRPGLGAIAGALAVVEVLAFARAPLRYGERLVAHDAAFRALTRWRVWLFDRLEPLAPGGLAAWHSGDLLSRAVDDVDALQDLYLRALTPVAVTVAAGALAVAVVAWLLPVAGLVLAVCVLVALVVPPALALGTRGLGRAEAAARAELAAGAVDLAQGAAELAAFGAGDEVVCRVERAGSRLGACERRRARWSGAAGAAVVVCTGAAVVGVAALGVAAVRQGRLDPVLLAALPLAALAAFETVPVTVAAAAHLGDVAAAGRRLLELADAPAPVVDPPDPGEPPTGAALAVDLDGVALRYGPDQPLALDGVDLHLPAGSRTAVTGSSGAGKTSLVTLLLAFRRPTSGRVAVGGCDLARLRQADARRLVALADQEARLFAGTVRQNLALARPDATDDELADALERAQLAGWVAGLPRGLDTELGEGGTGVSGGERRRLALARALLAGAPVLVLDEPTAGLDEPTANAVMAGVLARPGGAGPTVVVVTHHGTGPGTLDREVVLEGGRVVGPPQRGR